MKATIYFDCCSNLIKRRSRIEIELRETETGEKPVFPICGKMGRRPGQCLDDIAEYNSDPLFKVLYRLWKKYHLNDMHAGTEAQEKAVNKWINQGNIYNYKNACEYLKSINLYNDNGYKYGSSWLYRPIPKKDLEIIKTIIETYK